MTDNRDEIESLIRRANAGEAEALDALLTRYRPYLRVVAQRALRQVFQGKFDGSDAVQQTCLEAFHSIGSFRGGGAPEFHAWITRILERNLSNLMRDHTAQKRDVRRELSLVTPDSQLSLAWVDPASPESGPESRIIKGEAALLLAEALSTLNERQSTVLQMRFLEGYKLSEIADYLEITPPSVARAIESGLESLRRHMPREFSELE